MKIEWDFNFKKFLCLQIYNIPPFHFANSSAASASSILHEALFGAGKDTRQLLSASNFAFIFLQLAVIYIYDVFWGGIH